MAKKPWEYLKPAITAASKWLIRNGWLVGIPVAVCLLAALGYIVLSEKTWRASQSIIVRDDLLGESFKPGRFNSQESLKNAQETVLYVARQPDVIGPALEKLGPPHSGQSSSWIDQDRIEGEQSNISVVAPNGAEFGKTEVIVLNVRANTADRAKEYATLLAQQIERQLQQLRVKQLMGMQAELEQSLAQSQTRYDEVASQVRKLETEVGSDLSTLRSMIDNSSAGNEVHRFLEQIRADTRLAQQELESINKQLELLSSTATFDTTIPTSNQLLQMQPTLSRLYEGLAQAQLKASIESARYTELHPATQNHLQAVQETRQQIQNELATIQKGLESQRSLAQQKLERLHQSEHDYETRLTELGKRRVEYQVLTTELNKQGETLAKTKSSLSDIQSLTNPQAKLSLLTLVGDPQVDSRPMGLSKSMILLGSFLGGLWIGLGVIVLVRDPDEWGAALRWCRATVSQAFASFSASGNGKWDHSATASVGNAGSGIAASNGAVYPGGYAPTLGQKTSVPRPAAAAPTAATSLLSTLMTASQSNQHPNSRLSDPPAAQPLALGLANPTNSSGLAAPKPSGSMIASQEPASQKINIEPQLNKELPRTGSLRKAMGYRPYGAGRVDNAYQPIDPALSATTPAHLAKMSQEPEVVEVDPVLAAEQAARLSKFVGSEPTLKTAPSANDSVRSDVSKLEPLAVAPPEIQIGLKDLQSSAVMESVTPSPEQIVAEQNEFRRAFESNLTAVPAVEPRPQSSIPPISMANDHSASEPLPEVSTAQPETESRTPASETRRRRSSTEASYTPTINLEELRKSFEAAALTPVDPEANALATPATPATSETTDEADMALPKLPVESAEINVAKRLSELSKSIAAYCEPVKKKSAK